MQKIDIAVLSDIHSNYIGLKHCMEYALQRGIHTFLFLGDYVGEMAYPERTMELLHQYRRENQCTFIRGNKEDYWIDYKKNGATGWEPYNSTTGALWYAYQQLSDSDLHFFEQLPISQQYTVEGFPPLLLCHGTPDSVRGNMIRDEEATRAILDSSPTKYILCGHTHEQGQFSFHQKYVFNPGSVGLPLKGNGNSAFLILHGRNHDWETEFVSLAYDEAPLINQLVTSGLADYAPYWCQITAYLLKSKGDHTIDHAVVLKRAMELCTEQEGSCIWPNVPERYWADAIQEFHLPVPLLG